MMNSARLHVYPSGVGLSEVACKTAGVNDRAQRDRSRNNQRGCDRENDIESSALWHAPTA